MKKAALKIVPRQDDSYMLTGEEYNKLCDNFYEVQSSMRILRGVTHPDSKNQEAIDDLDIWNFCGIVLEKLKTIEPILGK